MKEVQVLVRPSADKPRVAHGEEIILPDKGLYWFDVVHSSNVDRSFFQVVVYAPSSTTTFATLLVRRTSVGIRSIPSSRRMTHKYDPTRSD